MRVSFWASVLLVVVAPASFADVAVKRVKTIDSLRVTAVATAYTGALVAVATEDGSVRIFDAAQTQTRFQLKGHPQTVGAVAFNRAGTALASGDATARLYLWDVKKGIKIREFPRDKGHTKGIISIAFSPDGTKIATVGNDDVIKIWKTSGGNPIATILGKGANLYGVAYTSSGAILTGTLSEGLRIYNGTTYQMAGVMTVPGGQGVNGIAANKDGTMALTAGRDGKLMMWSVPGRKKVQTYLNHTDWIINTAVSPNGKLGASSSVDRTVNIWDLATGKSIAKIEDTSPIGSPVGFTGDGKYFIATSASDGLTVYAVTPAQAGGATAPPNKKKATKKKK